MYTLKEDAAVFTGKRALISFLSWLDYCDQLIKEAQKVVTPSFHVSLQPGWCSLQRTRFIIVCSKVTKDEVCVLCFFAVLQSAAAVMARAVRERFFVAVMEPQLMQT